MRFSKLSLSTLAVPQAAAVNLWATSYGGGVATLNLWQGGPGQYALNVTAFLNGTTSCGPEASWLTKYSAKNVVYCVDEAWGQPNGSVTSFNISKDGTLALFDTQVTLGSPVSTVVYNDGKALAVAH